MNTLLLTYLLFFVVCFLTELTSNVATANILLPIMAAVSSETLMHPMLTMVPITVSCSFASLHTLQVWLSLTRGV